MDCNECRGKGVMYGAKCGFCYGTGKTGKKSKRNRSEAQERVLSHYQCTCGAYEAQMLSHGSFCPFSDEYKAQFKRHIKRKLF